DLLVVRAQQVLPFLGHAASRGSRTRRLAHVQVISCSMVWPQSSPCKVCFFSIRSVTLLSSTTQRPLRPSLALHSNAPSTLSVIGSKTLSVTTTRVANERFGSPSTVNVRPSCSKLHSSCVSEPCAS